MFGRKTMPAHLRPAWEAFSEQAGRVQAAREVVLSCLPVGRVERAPVPAGLEVLRDEVAAVASQLDRWRVPEVERHWHVCRDAGAEAVAAVPRAAEVAVSSGELEELLGAVADVLEPLGDAWQAAERCWLALRRRDPARVAPRRRNEARHRPPAPGVRDPGGTAS